MNHWSRTVKGLAFVVVFLLGGSLGTYVGTFIEEIPATLSLKEMRNLEAGTQFTNPLLECTDLPESISIGRRVVLQDSIEAYIASETAKGTITDAAVYFRDLNNGPWFGINEEQEFYPASLLKLPLAISFYFKAQDDPGILQQMYEYTATGDYESGQAFASTKRLEDKKAYTMQELISFMLQESSNEAAAILAQVAGAEQIFSIYKHFGITEPKMGADYEIDVHRFSSFFRVLFNATYLDRKQSEALLESMTHASFTEGIVAGVPTDVSVAHKFGTREIATQGVKQLHDCGIVYAKDTPYILCIMTQGKEYSALAGFIREVSSKIYAGIALDEQR